MRRHAQVWIAVAAISVVVALAAFAVVPRIAVAAGLGAPLPRAGGTSHHSTALTGSGQSAAPAPRPDAAPAAPTAMPLPSDDPVPPCPQTEMSVWAHPDDDLLFPQTMIAAAIARGDCIRTVFLTSGDAGRGTRYLQGRERGIMRAYDVLRGKSSHWSARPIVLSTGAHVTLWQPDDDDRLTLAFLHLPDGNIQGQGFSATGYESLAKLMAQSIPALDDTDGTYSLTPDGIVASLAELIGAFAPTLFITFVPGSDAALSTGDHADHANTGILARRAWQAAGVDPSAVRYAIGYPISRRAANVTGPQLALKIAAFRTYAADDSVVGACHDEKTCLAMPNFGAWLQREYTVGEGDLGQ